MIIFIDINQISIPGLLKKQTNTVAGLSQAAKTKRNNRNLVSMKYNLMNHILYMTGGLIYLITRNNLTAMIHFLILSCGSPLIYLLGIEENRKKTQALLKSKIEIFEKKKTRSPKDMTESNQQPSTLRNNWM